MQTYFFTGAAGFIGSHTAYCFLKNSDCKIIVLDNLCTGFVENIQFLQKKFPNRIEFVQGNFGDSSCLETIFLKHKIDGIVHFAGSLVVSESVVNPLLYYNNNVANTLRLLEVVAKYGVNRLLFSSTAAVYGQPNFSEPISEESQTLPINPYGESKLMVEKILRDFEVANPNFRSVILRYFNVAGALSEGGLGQRSKNATHLIKVACECACRKREKMGIFGEDYPTKDGTCIRDYIHIDDLANAHFETLKTLEKEGQSQIYNVGYGVGFSVKEVIECVKKVSGVDFEVEIQPRRAGDPAMLVSNNHKILTYTNWKPKYNDLELICKSAYEWERKV